MKRLSNPLQINNLKLKFAQFNPDVDLHEIDWNAVLDRRATLDENVEAFKRQYPQYRWDEEMDPYYFQVMEELRRMADEHGFEVVKSGFLSRLEGKNRTLKKEVAELKIKSMQNTKLVEKKRGAPERTDKIEAFQTTPVDQILSDVFEFPVTLVSFKGHGKSTLLKTLIKRLKKGDREVVVKAFDISLSWYHNAPLEHRQHITMKKWEEGRVRNIDDCLYEIGDLSRPERRRFVGWILGEDYKYRRYVGRKHGPEALDREPYAIYVFEEANRYFGSYSLRRGDDEADVFDDFISVGRNFSMCGFLVVTAAVGELSPSIRRRSAHIVGYTDNDDDIRYFKRKDKRLAMWAKSMKKYHWAYYKGKLHEIFTIPQEVEEEPVDYEFVVSKSIGREKVEVAPEASSGWKSWFIKIALIVTFIWWLLNL